MGVIDRLKRTRRRRNMRMRSGRGPRRVSRFRVSSFGPMIKIGGLVLGVAALAVLVILVLVPLFDGGAKPVETETLAPTPQPTLAPMARADMSDLDKELTVANQSINDPYIFGQEAVFSTGKENETAPVIDTISIYNLESQVAADAPGISKKYATLFEPKMNDKYIVYLDCKDEYGGAVCGYDRAAGESFVMREYLYGKPKVSLSGEYALWLQQTSKGTDRLYLYHLPTRETAEIEIFVNTPFSFSAPYMSDDRIVYVQPSGESQLLEGSSASTEAEIVVMPLAQNGDANKILFRPGVSVLDPMISGNNIVFIDTYADSNKLYLCSKEGDTYSAPSVIAENIVNYSVGDGFVAYTKDEAVYIYYFADQSSGRLTTDSSRVLLSSVCGKNVAWYDIADLSGANIVFYAQVP